VQEVARFDLSAGRMLLNLMIFSCAFMHSYSICQVISEGLHMIYALETTHRLEGLQNGLLSGDFPFWITFTIFVVLGTRMAATKTLLPFIMFIISGVSFMTSAKQNNSSWNNHP